MSDEKEDGGPAFPPHAMSNDQEKGMSLRDYFAAMAMQGLLSSMGIEEKTHLLKSKETPDVLIATAAYQTADAMIEARKS